jgi:hypothetical protein
MNRMRSLCLWVSLWLVTAETAAPGQSLQIGFTKSLAVTNYTQATMNRIGQFKWYFAHASVGNCMLEGLVSLHQSNPGFYPFQQVAEDGSPPANTQPGTIYDYMRFNSDWWTKVDGFQTYLSNGWHYPRVNLVMNKFCFTDEMADLNYYLRSMTNLEAAFAQTVLVYATMPLDTTTGIDNCLRNLFNDGLRDWCRTNNRILFDIADMEAHDPSGALCTFTYTNRVCQMLYSNYTTATDGAHPTSVYAEQLLARGFYAVTALLAVPSVPTTTTLSSSANPSVYGQPLTFTATVTAASGTPTGTVSFNDYRTNTLATRTLSGGQVSYINATLAAGAHSITAVYNGDVGFSPSTNAPALSQSVNKASSSAVVASSANPSVYGQSVTFTATVSAVAPGAGTPSGGVTFLVNGAAFSTNALVGGRAAADAVGLPVGTNMVKVEYKGDGNFLGSSNAQQQVVRTAASQTNYVLGIRANPDGTFLLSFLGTPQAEYYVVAQTNAAAPMPRWAVLAGSTNLVTNSLGRWWFTVTNRAPYQFYRSAAVPPSP